MGCTEVIVTQPTHRWLAGHAVVIGLGWWAGHRVARLPAMRAVAATALLSAGVDWIVTHRFANEVFQTLVDRPTESVSPGHKGIFLVVAATAVASGLAYAVLGRPVVGAGLAAVGPLFWHMAGVRGDLRAALEADRRSKEKIDASIASIEQQLVDDRRLLAGVEGYLEHSGLKSAITEAETTLNGARAATSANCMTTAQALQQAGNQLNCHRSAAQNRLAVVSQIVAFQGRLGRVETDIDAALKCDGISNALRTKLTRYRLHQLVSLREQLEGKKVIGAFEAAMYSLEARVSSVRTVMRLRELSTEVKKLYDELYGLGQWPQDRRQQYDRWQEAVNQHEDTQLSAAITEAEALLGTLPTQVQNRSALLANTRAFLGEVELWLAKQSSSPVKCDIASAAAGLEMALVTIPVDSDAVASASACLRQEWEKRDSQQ